MKHALRYCLICLVALSQGAKADDIAPASPQFNPDLFRVAAAQAFHGSVKGYQVAIVRNGTIVGTAAGGVAVDQDDTPNPMPMNVSVPMDVGSTMKMVSTVALLSFFEKDPNRTVDEWLDQNFLDYMPALWRDGLSNSSDPWKVAVGKVTFRELLQHKSGLKEDGHFEVDGVNPDRSEIKRVYVNNNITMLRYCLPYLVDPEWAAVLDYYGSFLDFEVAADRKVMNQALLRWFFDYIQASAFDQVSITASPQVTLPDGEWRSRLVPQASHVAYVTAPIVTDLHWGTWGSVPLVGDMDGDGADDLVYWREDTREWHVRSWSKGVLASGIQWGITGDRPLVGDVDGDGADDLVVWRPGNGNWYAKKLNGEIIFQSLNLGVNGDVPLLGNVDLNTSDDELVIYRPSTRRWFAKKADGELVFQHRTYNLGSDDYQPLLLDTDGDGIKGAVAWRPEKGEFEIAQMAATMALGTKTVSWGKDGDLLLAGDMEGDAREEIVLYRPSTHSWWARDIDDNKFFKGLPFGVGPVTPFVGDIDGDGQDDLITYRRTTGRWSAAGRRYAMSYNDIDSTVGKPAKQVDDPVDEGNSAGGYWFSAVEYAAWAGVFGHGNSFVSQAVRDLMFDESSEESRDDRLGWQGSFDTDPGYPFILDNYGTRHLPHHNGLHDNFRSEFVRLPDGYYGFVSANSTDLSTGQLLKRLLSAWITAMGGTTAEGGVQWPVWTVVLYEPPTRNKPEKVVLQSGSETVTLLGDEARAVVASMAAGDVEVTEGEGEAVITVSRSGSVHGEVSLAYSIRQGAATAADYAATDGMLRWEDGDGLDKSIRISIADDGEAEGSESFSVVLSQLSGAAIFPGGAKSHTVRVVIHDHPLDQWRWDQFEKGANEGEGQLDGDFDADGITNHMELVLQTDPNVANQPPFRFELSGGRLAFTFSPAPILPFTELVIEASDDLGPSSWKPLATRAAGSGVWKLHDQMARVEVDRASGVVTVFDSATRITSSRRFMRLGVRSIR